MATCRFCGQEFDNRQAVRAHLKACGAYLGRFARQEGLPEAPAAMPRSSSDADSADFSNSSFDPVTKMRQQVSAEKLRLTLREIGQAHAELDAREEARRRAEAERESNAIRTRQAIEREREAAREKAAAEAQARRQAEEAQARLKARRRELIQEAKKDAMAFWFPSMGVSSELHADILQAMEAALSPLPVEELPKAELVQIAQGVRDRVYNAAAQHTQRIRALKQFGMDYAQAELRDTEGLEVLERWRIEGQIKQELEAVTGQESHADIRAWIDDVLEREGISFADDEEGE